MVHAKRRGKRIMKRINVKFIAIFVLGFFALALFKGSAQSQSYWERRQKSQEQLRKKKLGAQKEEKKPEKKTPKTPIKSATETKSKKPAPKAEDIVEDAISEPWSFPAGFGAAIDLGNKEIKKLADKATYINPNSISVPDAYGTIKEVHLSDKGKEAPFIIHIQDAHVNYDAQISIAHLTEELLADYGVNLICVEGSTTDDARIVRFRLNAPLESRLPVAQKYLREGLFNGVEYLYGITDYGLDIRGIEEKEIYDKNLDAYFEIEKYRVNARKYLDSLKTNLLNLKSVVFSRDLNELEDNKNNYNSETITLTAYVKFLDRKSKAAETDIKSGYKNLAYLLETIEMEEKIDFPGVDAERDEFITAIKKKLGKSKSKKIDENQAKFRTGDMAAAEFYTYLLSLKKGDISKEYPNLALYADYINTFDKIDTYALFKEIDTLDKALRVKFYKNEEQKELDKLSTDFSIIREFVELGLTPDEYSYYQTIRNGLDIGDWASYIKSLQNKHNLKKKLPKNISSVKKIIPKLETFYRTAIHRDKILVERTLEHIKNSDANVCVMVCGGFHTPRITGIMRRLGVSYIVIAPKITNPTEPGLYDKVIRETSREEK